MWEGRIKLTSTGFVFDAMDPFNRPDSGDAQTEGGSAGIISSISNDSAYTGPINVPEPSSFLLLAAGAGGLALRRRRSV